eukprot:NODE_57_length_28844_cov_0.352687.p17 type:complete len:248 gc:universal NODE_57_length_28844_cov_0.352687:5348-4605(-)
MIFLWRLGILPLLHNMTQPFLPMELISHISSFNGMKDCYLVNKFLTGEYLKSYYKHVVQQQIFLLSRKRQNFYDYKLWVKELVVTGFSPGLGSTTQDLIVLIKYLDGFSNIETLEILIAPDNRDFQDQLKDLGEALPKLEKLKLEASRPGVIFKNLMYFKKLKCLILGGQRRSSENALTLGILNLNDNPNIIELDFTQFVIPNHMKPLLYIQKLTLDEVLQPERIPSILRYFPNLKERNFKLMKLLN